MANRDYKPTSPGRRFARLSDNSAVTKSEPEKKLTEDMRGTGGRNSDGDGSRYRRRPEVIDPGEDEYRQFESDTAAAGLLFDEVSSCRNPRDSPRPASVHTRRNLEWEPESAW